MCGFAGFLSNSELTNANTILDKMGEAIEHRGPDSQGNWLDESSRLGLSHRRLAIQDLSPLGHQPMTSKSKRFVMAFNGEVYNFKVLGYELAKLGWEFKGHSDTEVMLAAFEQWGVENALAMFTGMFAFALVDLQEKELYLARDRVGEKPLYYFKNDQVWLFGSELKALCEYPNWEHEINRDALPLLLRHNFIPAPHTIYKNTYKLLPSTFIKVCLDNGTLLEEKKYWHLAECFQEELPLTKEQASNELDEKLKLTIEEQMISDAPLGAFLSGGIDSSTVVGIMQSLSEKKINTFSIGFKDPKYNEAEHAKAVASHVGSNHHELYVRGRDALELIPDLSKIYDEPFADSSQLPTFILCRMAKEKVTVALSGDGGDELFCGYTRYFDYTKRWQQRNSFVNQGKKVISALPSNISIPLVRTMKSDMKDVSASEIRRKLEIERRISNSKTLAQFYKEAVSYWVEPEKLVIGAQEISYALDEPMPNYIEKDEKALMWKDLNWYLPDDILVKVDRASMANSLETRCPLLDHRIIEFALSLPLDINLNGNNGKQVLRSVLYQYVPQSLVERPKVGFAVPLAAWLRNELRDWADELLDSKRLELEGYWSVDAVVHIWQAHKQEIADYSFQLWSILMFQQWLTNVKR